MTDELKSDHYRNQRESIYNRAMKALPHRLRVSWLGRRYWKWIHADTARLFHCPPHDECAYCEDHVDQPIPDRIRYLIERVLP
jgi:hypothetical protein